MNRAFAEVVETMLDKQIDLFLHIKRLTKEEFIKFIQDTKHIPLDLRWNLYLKHGEMLLSIDSYYFEPDGIDWNRHTLFDDFCCDKYATMTVDNMTKQIEEKNLEVNMNEYKESWMQKGIWGFINDW